MRLYLGTLVAGTSLRGALARHDVTIVTNRAEADVALAVVDATTVETTRPTPSPAWCVAVVTHALLESETSFGQLLSSPAYDDWVPRIDWERWLWLSLRRFAQQLQERGQAAAANARRGALEGEMARLIDEATRSLPKAEEALVLARNVQRRLLAQFAPRVAGCTVHAKFLPGTGSGGDYYDLMEVIPGKQYVLLLADATTHGMVASLLSALLKLRPEELGERFPDPLSLAQALAAGTLAGPDAPRGELALFVGYLDRAALQLRIAVAGDLRPARFPAVQSAAAAAVPRLTAATPVAFAQEQWQLQPGDALVFATNGLARVLGKNDATCTAAIEELLRRSGGNYEQMELQNELVAVAHERGAAPEDDVTLLQLRVERGTLYVIGPTT